jgi:hypothetical protein
MTRTLTAMKVTPGVTYVTRDETPYRADWSGIVNVEAGHVSEMLAMTAPTNGSVPVQATATQVGSTHHSGAPLALQVEK